MHEIGQLASFGEKTVHQLDKNDRTKEIIFFSNMLELIGKMCRTATDKVCNSLVSHVPIKEITSLLKTISLIRTDLKLIFNGDSEIYKKACQHHFILPHMTNVISEITHSILNFHSRLISAKIDNSWDCSQSLLTLAIRDRDMLLAELNLPIHRSELPSMLIQLQQSGGHNRTFRRKYMNTLSTSNLNIEV